MGEGLGGLATSGSRLPIPANRRYLHAPLDLVDGFNVYLISALAETSLDRALRQGPLLEHEIATLADRLRRALGVLHGLRLVHSDVREDNVLRVDGAWKLADLGGVVEEGAPIVALQKSPEYVRPGAGMGLPADPANDTYALAVVLEHVRGMGTNGH
jgi:serine/threonine protein kinase